MSKEIESVNDIQDILAGDDGEGEEKDEKELSVENPEEDEDLKDDEEDEDKKDKEDEEDEDKEEKLEGVQFKAITKKYPTLFKDFPSLRHVFFHEKEYRELFPTMEEAREAQESFEVLHALEDSIKSGSIQDITKVIDSFSDMGEGVISNFSANFLPALRKLDQDSYFQAVTPVLVESIRTMFDAGVRNENDNLKNAAMVAALHLFGDPKVASGEKEIKLGPRKEESEKDNKLNKEREDFRRERYTTFYNDVVRSADSRLSELVTKGIDPKNTMTEGMKDLIAERVVQEISKTLGKNSTHTSRMNSLWKKAGNENFASSWKSKIISAYLEAAEEIMPGIRSKVRANVLGIRDRRPENNGGRSERREPKSTTGGGQSRKSSEESKKLDAKKIDWKKTSDIDLFNDKITFKS